MVTITQNLLVALLVALCATVNHAASISSSSRTLRTTSTVIPTVITTTDEATSEYDTSTPTITTTTESNDDLPDPTTETTKNESQTQKETNRTDRSRSLDLDINKYTSVDFHNKVYDLQTSPDNDKFVSHEVSKIHTTYRTSFTSSSQNINDYDNYELTTPVSDDFDKKHKDIQNSIKDKIQKFNNKEEEDEGDEENDNVNIQLQKEDKDRSEDNDSIKHNRTNIDFVRYTNVVADVDSDKKDKNDNKDNLRNIHRNLDVEKGLKVNYESIYNQSEVIDKVHNQKTPLLNNKIENDGDIYNKAINISKRGFTKGPVDSDLGETEGTLSGETDKDKSNLIPLETTTDVNGVKEQTQQENNIYPVLVPIPLTTSTTPGLKPEDVKFNSRTEKTIKADQEKGSQLDGEDGTLVTEINDSTAESSSTKLYEMTENDFADVAATSETAFDANVGSEEKFYEMTDIPTSTTVDSMDLGETTTLTTTTDLPSTTTKIAVSGLPINNSKEHLDVKVEREDSQAYQIATTDVGLVEGGQTTTLTNVEDVKTTTEVLDGTTTDNYQNAGSGTTDLPTSTISNPDTTTDVYGTISVQDVKSGKVETATETTEESPESTILSVIVTTVEKIAENTQRTTVQQNYANSFNISSTPGSPVSSSGPTTSYNGNAIVKDHTEATNEIKKDVTEHDLDDFTEESTDDDYIDIQRKPKPVTLDLPDVPSTPETPDTPGTLDHNKTVTETEQQTNKPNKTPDIDVVVTTDGKPSVTTPDVPATGITDTPGMSGIPGIPSSSGIPKSVTDSDVNDVSNSDINNPTTVSGEDADASKSEPEGISSGTIIAIVLSTVGAICLILLAILLFVMRRRQKRFNYGQRCTPVSLDAYSMDNVSVYNSVRRKAAQRGSKRSYGNPAFDDDTSVSHPLNFQSIMRFATQAEEIRTEFEEIPAVNAKMNELPDGCAPKNRYANVIPLPESRVFLTQLDDDATSDYINANFVTGPKGARGYYIACQAPLHNTVNDFWRMIWEQQSKVILMLTHLFENGVEKCVDYLPPSEVVDCHRLFGDYQVTLKKREVKDKYIISSLQLKNMVSNSWREVTHLWYSGWPEKGVPEEENSIIAFLIEARSYIKLVNSEPKENGIRQPNQDSSPVVVHCSPGTGRTGTVIACDIAIREFELRRIVDIPRIVYRIRRDRASSVQTKDQYHFIYKVINLYATKLTGGALDSI